MGEAFIGLRGPGQRFLGRLHYICVEAARALTGYNYDHTTGGFQPWDQHGDLKGGHTRNALATDRPIAGLLHDLAARGLLDETLVVWGGEFGRTPAADGNAMGNPGRNHNAKAMSVVLAGGGVKGGVAHGQTDELGAAAVDDRVHIHDVHATILHLLGFDHEKLTHRFQGRDFRLTDVHGSLVTKLLA